MKNLILVGHGGCGKTTVGKLIADKLKYKHLDTDHMLDNYLKQQGSSVQELFATNEKQFREMETSVLIEALYDLGKNNCILSTGGGIVLAEQNRQLLLDSGLPIIYMNIEAQTLKVRRPNKYDCLSEEQFLKFYDTRDTLYRKVATTVIGCDTYQQEGSGTPEYVADLAIEVGKIIDPIVHLINKGRTI